MYSTVRAYSKDPLSSIHYSAFVGSSLVKETKRAKQPDAFDLTTTRLLLLLKYWVTVVPRLPRYSKVLALFGQKSKNGPESRCEAKRKHGEWVLLSRRKVARVIYSASFFTSWHGSRLFRQRAVDWELESIKTRRYELSWVNCLVPFFHQSPDDDDSS